MIVASWKDVAERCFTGVVPSTAENMVIFYSQQCNFWEFLLATSLADDPNRQWHADELRKSRVALAHALKEWEDEKTHGHWEGWPLTGA